MSKMNCWEIAQCGREPGGANEKELGVCPASSNKRADSIHGGKNGGRCCWVIAGTFCRGEVQGTYAQKGSKCTECPFYKQVRIEEGPYFEFVSDIIKKIKPSEK